MVGGICASRAGAKWREDFGSVWIKSWLNAQITQQSRRAGTLPFV